MSDRPWPLPGIRGARPYPRRGTAEEATPLTNVHETATTSGPGATPARRGISLRELVEALPGGATLEGPDAGGVTVTDVTHDSRQAGPGVLYAARPGLRADGHDYGPDAVSAGSPALLVERRLDLTVPQVRVPSVAEVLGHAAAAVHQRPSERLVLAGVTGTNGKTTTAYLLEAVFRAAGHVTGLLGTVETRIAGRPVAGVRTTPESTDLQRLLRRMVDAGVGAAAMEVSSHGLALGRVTGTRFAVAIFTNLTQDHLDFHHDLEDYFAAKARLFDPEFSPIAVVNVDDPFGRRLADRVDARGEATAVRVSPGGGQPADVTARDVVASPRGTAFTAVLGGRTVPVDVALPGLFNVANALVALAAAEVVGVPAEVAARGMAGLAGVPGRMERVEAGQPFTVLVDYAHTPDSLEHLLRAARRLTDARLTVVIGCGGDRDRGKRPAMGRVAAELADRAVFTSDNPRSEDPGAILDAMRAGAGAAGDADVASEPDRRSAIEQALAGAGHGDLVVIAGKGHETYQELADRTVDFDDRVVARRWLTERYGGQPSSDRGGDS